MLYLFYSCVTVTCVFKLLHNSLKQFTQVKVFLLNQAAETTQHEVNITKHSRHFSHSRVSIVDISIIAADGF